MGGMGWGGRWGGVGWGGDKNKPCRFTRTWQLHRADFPFYQHLLMGGMGWGGVGIIKTLPLYTDLTTTQARLSFLPTSSHGWDGVGIITNLAALPGPDNYTGQTFLSTNIFLWVGWMGWGGGNKKPCRLIRTWQLHRPDFPFYQHHLMGGMGWGGRWGGVGWGGDNNKPCRFTRTWQLHRADFPFYQHLLVGGMGRGGVGIITNLAALHGPDNYTGQTFLSTNIFLWVGWMGWGGGNKKLAALFGPDNYTGHTFLSTNIFLWVGWGGVGGGVGCGGVGWGGDNNKPCRFTRTWQLHRADFPFYQHLLMGGMGWGGVGIITNLAALHGPDNYTGQTFLSTNIFSWVGWGGDNNKPCRFTRPWQLHRADFPFYQHLLMGGMGWGGVGVIKNLAALFGPDNYTGQIFLSTNIFLWVGWGGVGGGVGWGGVGIITNLAALPGPDNYTGQTFLSTNIFLWVGWGGVGWG